MTDLSLTLSPLTPADMPAIEKLDERAFGPGRVALSAQNMALAVLLPFPAKNFCCACKKGADMKASAS